MLTRSGHVVDLRDPDPATLDIEDIAHSLAKQPRYLGHGPMSYHYSVAEHSILMARHIAARYRGRPRLAAGIALATLLHDAAEAYTGDMPYPVKHAVLEEGVGALASYANISTGLQNAIAIKFNVFATADTFAAEIKALDRQIVGNEMRALFPCYYPKVNIPEPLPGFTIAFWPADYAYRQFVAAFRAYRDAEGQQ